MTSGQKVALSLLISVLAFCAFTVVAFSGLFDLIEVNFYQPVVQEIKQKKIEEIAAAQNEYFDTLMQRFASFSSDAAVKTYVESRPGDSSVRARESLRAQLVTATQSLKGIRIVSVNGRNIFFSTFSSDVISSRGGIAYRDYNVSDEIAYESVRANPSVAESAAPDKKCRIIKDGDSNLLIFSLPFYDAASVSVATILFYCDATDFSHFLFSRNLIDINGFAALVTNPRDTLRKLDGFGGFVFGLPNYGAYSIRNQILSRWRQSEDETFWRLEPVEKSGTETLSESRVLCAFSYRQSREDFGFITLLYDEADLKFPQYMRLLILTTALITFYLAVFLILSFKHDDIVVIRDKVRRYESEFFIGCKKMDGAKDPAYLAEQKPILERRILKSLGKKGERHLSEFKSIFESGWAEMLVSFGEPNSAAPSLMHGYAAPPINAEELKEIVRSSLEDILESGKVQIGVREVERADSRDDRRAVEKFEEVDAAEIFGEADVAAADDSGGVEEAEGLDDAEVAEVSEDAESLGDMESLEEAEVIEDVESLDDTEVAESAADAEPLGDMESLEGAEAVEEAESLDEAEVVDEAEIAEPLGDAESLEEAEVVEEEEALDEAEVAEVTEDAESLGDAEFLEEVEAIDEAETLDEAEVAGTADDAESLGDMDSLEGAEVVEEAESLDDAEVAEITDDAESLKEAEVVEEAEALEEAGAAESAADEAEALDDAEVAESTDDAESLEEAEVIEDVESLDDADVAEVTEDAEPLGDAESLEEVEAIDEVETLDDAGAAEPADDVESLEEAEAVDEAESLNDAEATESADDVEDIEPLEEEAGPLSENGELRLGAHDEGGGSRVADDFVAVETIDSIAALDNDDSADELEVLHEYGEKEERADDIARTLAALPEKSPDLTKSGDDELDSDGLSRKLSSSEMHDIVKLRDAIDSMNKMDLNLEELELVVSAKKSGAEESAANCDASTTDNEAEPNEDDVYKDEVLLEKIEFGVPTANNSNEAADDSIADNFVVSSPDYSFLDEDEVTENLYKVQPQGDVKDDAHFFENPLLLRENSDSLAVSGDAPQRDEPEIVDESAEESHALGRDEASVTEDGESESTEETAETVEGEPEIIEDAETGKAEPSIEESIAAEEPELLVNLRDNPFTLTRFATVDTKITELEEQQ